jgi:hypothetical protein
MLQNSFQSVSPETFRNLFLSIADYRFVASGPFLHRFESISLQVDRYYGLIRWF